MKQESVSEFRKRVFFQEFPWLVTGEDPWLSQEKISGVTTVKVRRITPELLDRIPSDIDDTCLVNRDYTSSERIAFFDAEGRFLGGVKSSYEFYAPNNGSHFEKGETIGEALLRVDSEQVYFIVKYCYEAEPERGEDSSCEVTVFKVPKGWTLPDWIEEQLRKAGNRLAAEIAAIDAEGGKF